MGEGRTCIGNCIQRWEWGVKRPKQKKPVPKLLKERTGLREKTKQAGPTVGKAKRRLMFHVD